jgi:hypothetical protein
MMRVLAIFFGVILLLPGLCALVSMAAMLPGSRSGGTMDAFGLLWLVCFAISFGGVMLILRGGRKRPPPPASPPE